MARIRCCRCPRSKIVKVIPSGEEAETVRSAVEAAATFEGWGGTWRAWTCPPCSVAGEAAH
jgi:hypothetical protein